MYDLNKAMIIGRLTQDPEIRTTPGGQTVTSFSVATNFVWIDSNGERQEKPEFHNVVAWRKLGEICGQYLQKGRRVYIEGRLQTRNWEGQDGIRRYRTEIIADNMIILDRAQTTITEEPTPPPPITETPEEPIQSTPPKTTPIQKKKTTDQGGNEEINVEDIPF